MEREVFKKHYKMLVYFTYLIIQNGSVSIEIVEEAFLEIFKLGDKQLLLSEEVFKKKIFQTIRSLVPKMYNPSEGWEADFELNRMKAEFFWRKYNESTK